MNVSSSGPYGKANIFLGLIEYELNSLLGPSHLVDYISVHIRFDLERYLLIMVCWYVGSEAHNPSRLGTILWVLVGYKVMAKLHSLASGRVSSQQWPSETLSVDCTFLWGLGTKVKRAKIYNA